MEIVYQDNRIVVALKPAGVLSTDEPGGMPSLLRQALGTDRIRTVHRLDAQTGGLMVFARSRRAAALLSQQLRERQFSKDYLAAVHGTPQPPSGQLRDLLGRDSVRRITYVADGPSPETREALLSYETLDRAAGLSLLRIHLYTGRTHQIRVQFASRKHPLYGDGKYGSRHKGSIALQSCGLQFVHHVTGKDMKFELPLPQTGPWREFLE